MPQILGIHYGALFTLPAQFLQRRERSGPRPSLQVGQQGAPVVRVDPGIRQVARKQLRVFRDFRWLREEVRRFDSERQGALAPYDLVQQVLHALDRGQQGRPGRPFHRVAAQAADRVAVRIENTHLAAQHFRRLIRVRFGVARGFAELHVAHHPFRQPPRQPHALPAEGQIRRAALGPRHVARNAHDLEATVQNERMHVQSVPGVGFRQRNLPHRLARPGPCALQRAEAGTEIDPRTRPVPVVARDVHGRESGLQRFQVDPLVGLAGFRTGGARCNAPFHVDRPKAFIPLAVDLYTSRRRRLGRIEHDLNPAAVFSFFALLEDHRVV